MLFRNNIDFAIITESWLYNYIPNSIILPVDEFTIYRHDRETRGGGACIIVRNCASISSQQVSLPAKFSPAEIVCVDLSVSSTCGSRIIALYVPPCSVQDEAMCNLIAEALEYLFNTTLPVCIMGDLNLPLIDWSNKSTTDNATQSMFLNLFMSNSFNQLVYFPTRGANILDLILTDDPSMIVNVRGTAPLGSSDHLCILFNFEFVVNDSNNFVDDVESTENHTTSNLNLSYYNTSNIDWQLANDYLSSIDWVEVFNCNCVDYCWESFYCIVVFVISLIAPAKRNFSYQKRIQRGRKGKPYKSYPKQIGKLSNKKLKAWKRYKLRPSLRRKATYKRHAIAYKNELKLHICAQENNLINSKNCLSFFKYVNKKIKSKGSLSPLLDSEGNIVVYDLQKASILNSHFSSVFIHDNNVIPNLNNVLLNDVTNNNRINCVYFSPVDVHNQIKKLKSSSAPGWDGMSATLLKNLINVVSFPLSILFNLSISSGAVPKSWKRAIVIPIFKSGEAKSPTNYRPISLTPIASKLMEGIVKDSIIRHCNSRNLLSEYQFGFLPRRSANLQLIQYHELVANNCSKGYQTDSVYLDFKAAFDSVVHSKLLHKLKQFGIGGNLIQWIESFLSERFFSVRVGNCYSDWSHALSGVPQGSVLGPLLFVLFINDLTKCCCDENCNILMFADDAKCLSVIKSYQDCEKLQSTLTAIENWSTVWQLPLALHKCQVMSFTGRNAHIDFQYSIRKYTLSSVNTITDLGIILSTDLSFAKQIDKICSKARSRSAMILKCFQSRDKKLLFRAFTVYVRPILEYCCNVWSPYRLCDIRKIESVQRLFTKRLIGLKGMSYLDRLKCLETDSLEMRRIKCDLSMYYKILHEIVDMPHDRPTFFQVRDVRTRSNGLTIHKDKFKCNVERYFFRNRCINIWNMLPQNVVCANNLSLFKNRLNALDLDSIILKASVFY